jgi:uncharacterized protein YjbI with pentapeptide repeats
MIEIKKRITGEVLWTGEAASLRDAVIAAVKAGADLSDADLARANLAGAYLRDADLARANLAGAYLRDADLADANLADANLAGAYLRDADLADANLADANLAGAYLAHADLAGAYLVHADLAGANLAGADLAGAYLAGADLAGADNVDPKDHVEPTEPYVRKTLTGREARLDSARRYRERHPEVPVVEHLDATVLEAVQTPGNTLEMCDWHTCNTTHCRGGWAVHLAGKAGYELEEKLGSAELAARAIYRASTGRVPHFFATNDRALEDIRRCAAEEAHAGETAREA